MHDGFLKKYLEKIRFNILKMSTIPKKYFAKIHIFVLKNIFIISASPFQTPFENVHVKRLAILDRLTFFLKNPHLEILEYELKKSKDQIFKDLTSVLENIFS